MKTEDPVLRSRIMAAVGRQNTAPELLARSLLHRLGYRFTVEGPKNRVLPGRPDIVLPGRKTVIFVHGCFWHGHKKCGKFGPPKTRTDWWNVKIERNRERDRQATRAIQSRGWKVIIVWECELHPKNRDKFEGRLRREIPDRK